MGQQEEVLFLELQQYLEELQVPVEQQQAVSLAVIDAGYGADSAGRSAPKFFHRRWVAGDELAHLLGMRGAVLGGLAAGDGSAERLDRRHG